MAIPEFEEMFWLRYVKHELLLKKPHGSEKAGQGPITFGLTQVIPGWTEILQQMVNERPTEYRSGVLIMLLVPVGEPVDHPPGVVHLGQRVGPQPVALSHDCPAGALTHPLQPLGARSSWATPRPPRARHKARAPST